MLHAADDPWRVLCELNDNGQPTNIGQCFANHCRFGEHGTLATPDNCKTLVDAHLATNNGNYTTDDTSIVMPFVLSAVAAAALARHYWPSIQARLRGRSTK